jgi:hypothetical protein
VSLQTGVAGYHAAEWEPWVRRSSELVLANNGGKSGRKVLQSARTLAPNETASARAKTVLVPDPTILPHWEPSARLLLQGDTWDGIGEDLFGRGTRGPRGGALGHSAIRNFLTRPELVGKIDYADRTVDPPVTRRIEAQWEPMVDVELFRRVEEEVARRAQNPRNQQRRERGTFLLRPACGSCGAEYHGSRSEKVTGDGRAYVHGRPTIRDGDLYDRFQTAGCRQFNVVADELESAIRDVILEQRGSDSYAGEMRELLGARERFRDVAGDALAAARLKLEELQRKRDRVLHNSLELDLSSEEGEVVRARLDMLRQQIIVAEAEIREIEEQSRSQAVAWDRLAEILDETRNLAEAWDNVDLAERKILLDMWVLDVVVVVEPVPGKAKKNRKTAYVTTLHSAPDLPRELDLSLKRARANSSSCRTQG